MDVVTGAGQRKRVGAFCATHIEDYAWRLWQISCKQLASTFSLQAPPCVQSITFKTLGIVSADIRFKLHTPQLSRHSAGVHPRQHIVGHPNWNGAILRDMGQIGMRFLITTSQNQLETSWN
jgi:hypothetical protein